MTVQGLIDALDKHLNATDSFKIIYLKGFIEIAIFPYLTKKQIATVQLELQRQIANLNKSG